MQFQKFDICKWNSMKAKANSKKKTKRRGTLRSLGTFSDEWIAKVREGIKSTEQSNLDKPERTFSKHSKFLFAFFCLAMISLSYTTPDQARRIFKDAERTCNRFGASFYDERQKVSRCLTKDHTECCVYYDSIVKGHVIECVCSCHSRKGQ